MPTWVSPDGLTTAAAYGRSGNPSVAVRSWAGGLNGILAAGAVSLTAMATTSTTRSESLASTMSRVVCGTSRTTDASVPPTVAVVGPVALGFGLRRLLRRHDQPG